MNKAEPPHGEDHAGSGTVPAAMTGLLGTGATIAGVAAANGDERTVSVKDAGIDPHKPILTDPYKPIVTNPHKPIVTDPYKSIVTDPYKPIVDQPEATFAAIPAAGAGVASVAKPTVKEAEDDEDDMVSGRSETNWLLLLVQRVKDTYQGLNPHAVSRLWQGDKGYDCSALQQYESITLEVGQSGKLGSVECGVLRTGFVTVSEDNSNIGEKTAILFSYTDTVVCRDADDKYHFIRVSE